MNGCAKKPTDRTKRDEYRAKAYKRFDLPAYMKRLGEHIAELESSMDRRREARNWRKVQRGMKR